MAMTCVINNGFSMTEGPVAARDDGWWNVLGNVEEFDLDDSVLDRILDNDGRLFSGMVDYSFGDALADSYPSQYAPYMVDLSAEPVFVGIPVQQDLPVDAPPQPQQQGQQLKNPVQNQDQAPVQEPVVVPVQVSVQEQVVVPGAAQLPPVSAPQPGPIANDLPKPAQDLKNANPLLASVPAARITVKFVKGLDLKKPASDRVTTLFVPKKQEQVQSPKNPSQKNPPQKKSGSPKEVKSPAKTKKTKPTKNDPSKNPWEKFINTKPESTEDVKSLDQEALNNRLQKAILAILEDLRVKGKSVQYQPIKKWVYAGADPSVAWKLVEDDGIVDQSINHTLGYKKRAFKRSVFFQINLGLLQRLKEFSTEKPFGDCGNKTCLLAEHILILTAPSGAKCSFTISRDGATARIPKLIDACGGVEHHTMNNKPLMDVLCEALPHHVKYVELKRELIQRGVCETFSKRQKSSSPTQKDEDKDEDYEDGESNSSEDFDDEDCD